MKFAGSCTVFTFKEGLLAAVAHDLKLKMANFEINVAGDNSIEAKFDPRSLKVIAAMKDGAENPSALADKDKRQIEENIEKDVLHPKRYPEIRFRSTQVSPSSSGFSISGMLNLQGKEREITFQALKSNNRYSATIEIDQRDFEQLS